MERNLENNIVHLVGEIANEFEYSHELFGEKFYKTELSVMRSSETFDTLPIIVSERLAQVDAEWKGQFVSIMGQFRSFNKHEELKSRLVLSVFVRDMETLPAIINKNDIYLRGYICKAPIYRKTPLGREITDVLIAVNRSYGKSDYIPCLLWGRNARYASTLEVGTSCELWGRIQSREYIKKHEDGTEETKVAYEVSVSRIEE